MIDRRFFITSSAMALLAGCQSTTQSTASSTASSASNVSGGRPDARPPGNPPKAKTISAAQSTDGRPVYNPGQAMTPEIAKDLRIVDVEVRLASDFSRSSPENGVSDAFILTELKKTIPGALRAANPGGQFPVRAVVEVKSFGFATAAKAIAGVSSSAAKLNTNLYFIDTGDLVGRPAVTNAMVPGRLPLGGLIGAASIKAPSEEVRLVASGAGKAVASRIYGSRQS